MTTKATLTETTTQTTTHTSACTPGNCRCEAMAEIGRLCALPMGKGREIHGRRAQLPRDSYEAVKLLF